jgi:aminoglycoside phosphotransferase family enzyme/predicted kinase
MQRRDEFATQAPLIEALRDPRVFGAECTAVDVVETHISWVVLTGAYAYKIKKAVTLAFLDFGTLALRHRFCQEELRLNRRLAPDLYVDVVAITGSVARPSLGGTGPAIEYAVRMREFPQSALLSHIAERGELVAADIDALAATVARFHRQIDRAGAEDSHGEPEEILRYAEDNFTQILSSGVDPGDGTALFRLRDWTRGEYALLRRVFDDRRRQGFVRECHGDLHLANVARFDGQVTVFDGIEYADALRWIDVVSEIAFTVMDLEDRGQAAFAHRFLNAYLEATGDYAALAVLRFYVVYRALVRAKVACLRAGQLPPGPGHDELRREFHGYVALAQRQAVAHRAAVVVTHGFAGSGKTTLTQSLLEALGAVRVRSDVERKRLFGLAATASSGSGVAAGLYTPEVTRATYLRARDHARAIATSGRVALVDATFLARWQRDLFRGLADELGVPFAIIDCPVAEPTLRARIAARRSAGNDASEADAPVLDRQLRIAEVLAADELSRVVTVDAGESGPAVSAALLQRLAALLDGNPARADAASPSAQA